ncbi:hypothetical protein L596_012654 [Steinernema carpocapsae]|uniref:G-protein coupled receptors family 1 profile domain-containing protein n=1 Tax=Steinernema carpocapsae TaxID=34508 RepID=A0A4U5NYI8_STECR|nr:hypothetical protein L596_012654 [Steinernema carpocapsae]
MESLLDKIISAICLISLPVILFVGVIIYCTTPATMKRYKYFLLNIMAWNFMNDVILVLVRPSAEPDSMCLKFNGSPFGLLLLVFVKVNLSCSLSILFQYKLAALIFKKVQIKTKWYWIYSTFLHLFFSVLTVVLVSNWSVHPSTNLVCPNSPSDQKLTTFGLLTITIILNLTLITCVVWSFIKMSSQSKTKCHKNTTQLRKQLVNNIITLSGIPGLFTGLPSITVLLGLYFNKHPMAVHLGTFVLSTHGLFFSVATILVFKKYRQSVYYLYLKARQKPVPEEENLWTIESKKRMILNALRKSAWER